MGREQAERKRVRETCDSWPVNELACCPPPSILWPGLPKENADVLGRAFRESKEALQEAFHAQSLRFPAVRDVEWRVDHILAASDGSSGAVVSLLFRLAPAKLFVLPPSASATAIELVPCLWQAPRSI